MRTIDVPAEEVRRVRTLLMLSQEQMAAELKVSRRTIIRAEERGMETPWWSRNPARAELRKRWNELKGRAETGSVMAQATGRVKVASDTSPGIPREVSLAGKRPSSRKCHSDTQRPRRPGRDRRRAGARRSVTSKGRR